MLSRFPRLIDFDEWDSHRLLHVVGVVVATLAFLLTATLLVAYEGVFAGSGELANLREGDIAPVDIRSPQSIEYTSQVLTERERRQKAAQVPPRYFPPDPAVARQQTVQAVEILAYITTVREDVYATLSQKINDLNLIDGLTLDNTVSRGLVRLDSATWADVSGQVTQVLERAMQGQVTENDLASIRNQLPTQVGVRFTDEQTRLIVDLVDDLLRPNTSIDEASTAAAQQAAVADLNVIVNYQQDQIVARAGERISPEAFEAMQQLGLLQVVDDRAGALARAFLANVIIMVATGLYVLRLKPSLLVSSRFIAVLAGLFLIFLFGARIASTGGQLYLYPTAALALILTALTAPEIAVLGMMGLGALIGIMTGNSLEMSMLVVVGGVLAAMTLRRAERLNSYFMPGLLVAAGNIAVMGTFYHTSFSQGADLSIGSLLLYCFLNGILSAVVAIGALYLVSVIFNFPTAVKLLELSQPNHPLLQRLLREAPGTYQHSLQVANLSEQAANAISANADLVRVAALYHDIGKMANPAFFTENQVEGVNPHDTLNDPARSADIIINHVTDGERIARQYRLPARIRDFILEHHGTQVLHFYQIAKERADDDEVVDEEQFTYPGPKPQSRETAILMLADSTEATVRARKPTRKNEISEIVQQSVESKIKAGQLDESGLTLNDLKIIRRVFVDMLQGIFHPRISYPVPAGVAPVPKEIPRDATDAAGSRKQEPKLDSRETARFSVGESRLLPPTLTPARPIPRPVSATHTTGEMPRVEAEDLPDDDDDAPLPIVPPLPRTTEMRAVQVNPNGSAPTESAEADSKKEG
jgi:putative nucleotidyltransferase with HDIG domain